MISASESTPTLTSWLLFDPTRNAPQGTAPPMSDHRVAVVARLRELAPYAALLALPGGSLMALSLWLYRRQQKVS